MDMLEQLRTVVKRLEEVDHAGEWIARETIHSDAAVSQSGSLICALAHDLQERLEEVLEAVEGLLDAAADDVPFH